MTIILMAEFKLMNNSIKKYVVMYLFISGVLLHLAIVVVSTFSIKTIVSTGLPLPVLAKKAYTNVNKNHPNIAPFLNPVLVGISSWKKDIEYGYVVDPFRWQGVGATVEESSLDFSSTIQVFSTETLLEALVKAKAGDVIELLPGEYSVPQSRIKLQGSGLANAPIRIVAQKLGEVTLYLRGEGFLLSSPYWHFQNLHLVGSCKNHSNCEHAFHVVGNGHHATFENNIFQDFNAAIKVNGLKGNYPDYGKVIGNTFYNTSPRQTANPVTPFDLMHANDWQVNDNFIFDFIKAKGNKVSYGAFFKGGSQNGVFSRNLIMCNANLQAKTIAIGLSLGGGGSPNKRHRDGNDYEHTNGVIRNNIIMNCANDVGIYLNKATNSTITNNILYNTLGIDVRFKESLATISNNVLSGRIKARSNGRITQNSNNLVLSRSWLTAAEPLDDLFYAPVNGDFTWQTNAFEPMKAVNTEMYKDFCGKKVSFPYVGAYAGTDFCRNSMNLTNAKRQFKFTRDYEQHNEN